jgi:apolipoprotein N-acyltransferase
LRKYSESSLFPPNGNTCYGIPDLPATQCVSLLTPNPQGTRYAEPTNLVVWPEAPNQFFEIDQEFRASMSSLARASNAPVIVGDIGLDQDPEGKRTYYNSADFITSDGNFAGRYDKMHLVPFGEYTPYKRLFFFAGSCYFLRRPRRPVCLSLRAANCARVRHEVIPQNRVTWPP